MKILRIIYDWPKPWQGLAPGPYEITSAQVKAGHEVEVMCGYWPKSGGPEKPQNIKIHPIIREPYPGSIFFTSSVLLFFRYLAWRKNNKVDVIHSHGHFAIWIYLYRRLLQRFFPWAKELKTPLVVHFHNVAQSRMDKMEESGIDVKTGSKYVAWPLEIYSNKLAVRIAAACIFVSNENKEEAIKLYGVDQRRCFVVETGVNADLFKPVGGEEKEKSRKDLGLDIYDKVILNHGLMSERKNINLLVDAVALLPPHYKLLLVGSGDSTYIEKINENIKIKGLEERVMKIGYTPYPEVPIAYQVSDVFCLPSVWEGLPKAVMQGLACGIPCLVSGFKLSEELSGLYYLDNLEASHIAQRIVDIVENPVPVDVQKTTLLYSWERRSQEIDKIYEFAIKNYLV
jgi:glycosyltransferase involved in cell wall biosynthesis